MSESPDDIYKELLDIIHQLITAHVTGDEEGKLPPAVGVKFVLNGGTIHLAPVNPQPRTIPIEVFEDDKTITIQTALPTDCPDDFFLAYQDGKLQLNAGIKREYAAVIPVQDIEPSLNETHLKNGVLEIVCVKKAALQALPHQEE